MLGTVAKNEAKTYKKVFEKKWKQDEHKVESVNLDIQSEYGRIRNRKNSVFGHFSHSGYVQFGTIRQSRIQKSVEIQDWPFVLQWFTAPS